MFVTESVGQPADPARPWEKAASCHESKRQWPCMNGLHGIRCPTNADAMILSASPALQVPWIMRMQYSEGFGVRQSNLLVQSTTSSIEFCPPLDLAFRARLRNKAIPTS